MHTYPGPKADGVEDAINAWKALAGEQRKQLFVEELGIGWRKNKAYNIVRDWAATTDALNTAGVPWLAWSIVPEVVPECEDDYDADTDPNVIPINQPGVDLDGALKRATEADLTEWGFGY